MVWFGLIFLYQGPEYSGSQLLNGWVRGRGSGTVTIWILNTWIPDWMWLGGPFEYQTFWTINRQFSVCFSDHYSNTRPFDNQTQIYHLNTSLVLYKDGYFIWVSDFLMVTENTFNELPVGKLLCVCWVEHLLWSHRLQDLRKPPTSWYPLPKIRPEKWFFIWML